LTYISSLFNLSIFAGFFALLHRKLACKVVGVVSGTAIAAITLLYISFTLTFFREILPSLLASSEPGGSGEPSGLVIALKRIPLFYGYGYPALSVTGLLLAWKRMESRAWHPLLAYFLSFVLLVTLRATSGLFKDLKEILFIGPFVAVASAVSLITLGSRGGRERTAVVLIVLSLLLFGLWKYGEYLSAYTSLFGIEELD
jgi:hypothetical protein